MRCSCCTAPGTQRYDICHAATRLPLLASGAALGGRIFHVGLHRFQNAQLTAFRLDSVNVLDRVSCARETERAARALELHFLQSLAERRLVMHAALGRLEAQGHDFQRVMTLHGIEITVLAGCLLEFGKKFLVRLVVERRRPVTAGYTAFRSPPWRARR